MIAANEEGKVGCNAGTAVVLVEIANSSIFLGYGHAIEVVAISDCLSLLDVGESRSGGRADLEIAPNDHEANTLPVVYLTSLLNGGVDSVESTMTLESLSAR